MCVGSICVYVCVCVLVGRRRREKLLQEERLALFYPPPRQRRALFVFRHTTQHQDRVGLARPMHSSPHLFDACAAAPSPCMPIAFYRSPGTDTGEAWCASPREGTLALAQALAQDALHVHPTIHSSQAQAGILLCPAASVSIFLPVVLEECDLGGDRVARDRSSTSTRAQGARGRVSSW